MRCVAALARTQSARVATGLLRDPRSLGSKGLSGEDLQPLSSGQWNWKGEAGRGNAWAAPCEAAQAAASAHGAGSPSPRRSGHRYGETWGDSGSQGNFCNRGFAMQMGTRRGTRSCIGGCPAGLLGGEISSAPLQGGPAAVLKHRRLGGCAAAGFQLGSKREAERPQPTAARGGRSLN